MKRIEGAENGLVITPSRQRSLIKSISMITETAQSRTIFIRGLLLMITELSVTLL